MKRADNHANTITFMDTQDFTHILIILKICLYMVCLESFLFI